LGRQTLTPDPSPSGRGENTDISPLVLIGQYVRKRVLKSLALIGQYIHQPVLKSLALRERDLG